MRIKKLTNSNVLKPGQLLVVLHWNQGGSEALFDLRKSIRIGVVQLYRHRREPVPWIGRSGNGRFSGAREQRMSGGLTTATRRQKKSSYLAASPSNSGKNEIRIGCPTLMTIYLSGFSEAGRNMGKAIRFSHEWQSTPIHLVGCNIDLDRHTSGVVGAARTSPHGLVQETLNRSQWSPSPNPTRQRYADTPGVR